jgi:hypothetical protein
MVTKKVTLTNELTSKRVESVRFRAGMITFEIAFCDSIWRKWEGINTYSVEPQSDISNRTAPFFAGSI